MRHLSQGMDTGIGAARAGHGDPLARKFFHRAFQRALHRSAIILALPADKGRPVIFQRDAIAHQEKTMPGGRTKPFNSSRASITPLPARWTFSSLSAPSPQATVRSSVMTSPGAPRSVIGMAQSI